MHTLEQLRSGALAGIQRLSLRGLSEFPREIYALANTLEILDLSDGALSSLPDDLPRLHRLRIVFCSQNRFTELPAVLGRCAGLSMVGFKSNRIRTVPAEALPPQLRWLVLTDNQIAALPDELGRRPLLQKLMLAGNRLRTLPGSMDQLHRLELLRIAANQLDALPDWLLALPRLSWLAYAGNPFCAGREAALAHTPSTAIDWSALRLGGKLGEGASGVIHRAEWRRAGGAATPVAVKLFKGAMTSDGSPLSEMAACLNAGAHPHLIPVLGHVAGHPDQAHGLVMALIDPAFRNLAGPPSLASCTRDVYEDGKRCTLDAALAIARGIASAASQLHAHGIMHGDLYGHNILHCGQGRTLLGDFGAASCYDPAGPQAARLQALEVRAFGCLLEELLDRCDQPPARLRALQAACLQDDGAARPGFQAIKAELDKPF